MIRKHDIEIAPVGVDGSAAGSGRFPSREGFIRAIAIDYQNQPVTTDVVIKADSSTGRTLFTNTDSNTDVAPVCVASAGADETGAATAATDVGSGGWPISTGVYASVAQGDGQTSGNEKVIISVWLET